MVGRAAVGLILETAFSKCPERKGMKNMKGMKDCNSLKRKNCEGTKSRKRANDKGNGN